MPQSHDCLSGLGPRPWCFLMSSPKNVSVGVKGTSDDVNPGVAAM